MREEKLRRSDQPKEGGNSMNIVTILLVVFLIVGIIYFAKRA